VGAAATATLPRRIDEVGLAGIGALPVSGVQGRKRVIEAVADYRFQIEDFKETTDH
jgi:hypothetical protein